MFCIYFRYTQPLALWLGLAFFAGVLSFVAVNDFLVVCSPQLYVFGKVIPVVQRATRAMTLVQVGPR